MNTKFYRVKAKPWPRISNLMNRSLESRSNFSASTTFSNELVSDPIVPMDMSSSTIPIDASNRMSQSCLSNKSTYVSKK
jgi:hypothetical protein